MKDEVFELSVVKSGAQGGMLDVDAGHAEAVLDGFAEDEATEDGGANDGISTEVGEGIDAFDGNVFSDGLVG